MARTLGVISIGLGLAQIIAPGRVAQIAGITRDGGSRVLLRTIGAREIATGIGILTAPNRTGWMWARIGGDALNLAMLRKAMTSENAHRGRVFAATAATIGVTAADAMCARKALQQEASATPDTRTPIEAPVAAAVTIDAPPAAVFPFWDGFQSLPRFMTDLARVESAEWGRPIGRSRFLAAGPRTRSSRSRNPNRTS